MSTANTAPIPGPIILATSGGWGPVARTASHHGSSQEAAHSPTTANPPALWPNRDRQRNINGQGTQTKTGLKNNKASHNTVITLNHAHPSIVETLGAGPVSCRCHRYSREVPSTYTKASMTT